MNVDLEQFNCPICFLLPEKEIYQCKNGHILCDKCIAKMRECPQCRVTIKGIGRGRNRALEEILDGLKIDCSFSVYGCETKVKRGEVEDHKSTCKFAKEVSLCKLLYLPKCNFKVTFANLDKVARHIATKHDRPPFTAGRDGIVTIELPSFFSQEIIDGDAGIWARIIQFSRKLKPLEEILFVTLIKNNFLSWIFLDLNKAGAAEGQQTQAEISSEETPLMSWKLPVYHVIEAQERIRKPSFKTYMPSLVEQRGKGPKASSENINYKVNIKITDLFDV